MAAHFKGTAALGFTLLEVVVAISIVGAVTAISLPAYHEYIVKMQASEGQNMLLATGALAAKINEQRHCAIGVTQTEGKYGTLAITGTYEEVVGSTCRTSCVATYTFNDGVSSALQDTKISAEILNSGQVSLLANQTTTPSEYRPKDLKTIPVSREDACAKVVRVTDPATTSTDGTSPDMVAASQRQILPPPPAYPVRPYSAVLDTPSANHSLSDNKVRMESLYSSSNPYYYGIPQAAYNKPALVLPNSVDAFTMHLHAYMGYGYTQGALLTPGRTTSYTYAVDIAPTPADSNYVTLATGELIKPSYLRETIYTTLDSKKVLRRIEIGFESLPEEVFNSYSSITLSSYRYAYIYKSSDPASFRIDEKTNEVTIPRVFVYAPSLSVNSQSKSKRTYELYQELAVDPLSTGWNNQLYSYAQPWSVVPRRAYIGWIAASAMVDFKFNPGRL